MLESAGHPAAKEEPCYCPTDPGAGIKRLYRVPEPGAHLEFQLGKEKGELDF